MPPIHPDVSCSQVEKETRRLMKEQHEKYSTKYPSTFEKHSHQLSANKSITSISILLTNNSTF